MNYLTNFRLIEIFKQNKYILVRFADGELIGINCKVALITARKNNVDFNKLSSVVSYRTCNFSEYLLYKIPILKP